MASPASTPRNSSEHIPHLFRAVTFRSVTARNRIVLSPMCQYSADDGLMNDWHFAHLAARAVGGCGIVFTEATHTTAQGRITKHCLGLWNSEQRDRMRHVAGFVETQGAIPAIQIGHAGRKGSTSRPWEGSRPLASDHGAWQTISATSNPFADYPAPQKLDEAGISRELENFRVSTRFALEAGFKIVEIHAAHGYLIHQFYSPIANDRDDAWGGSFSNRIRFLLEAVDAVRSIWPAELPLFVRISVTDWIDGGWSLADSIELAKVLKAGGKVDLIDCSSGGIDPRQKIAAYPGFQVPFASAIRSQAGIATGAVGMIASPELAESIVASGDADIVVIGRKMLANPSWPHEAAKTLHYAGAKWPVQYERGNIF